MCICAPSVADFAAGLFVLGHALVAFVLVLAVVISICVYTLWAFALPLAVDRGLGFWDAMQLSRRVVQKAWPGFIGLVVVSGLLGMSGALACCVGVLFTMPLPFAAIAFAYEDIFGPKKSIAK